MSNIKAQTTTAKPTCDRVLESCKTAVDRYKTVVKKQDKLIEDHVEKGRLLEQQVEELKEESDKKSGMTFMSLLSIFLILLI